jgi:hypothetical protein
MTTILRELMCKKILQFYKENGKLGTVRHFLAEGEKRSTIYRIIKRYETEGIEELKRGSGRKAWVATPEVVKKVKRQLVNTNRSVREVGRKVGIHWTTVQKIKERYEIKTNKCPKIPKYTESQRKRVKTNCRKLYRMLGTKVVVIDDETYCIADPKQIPGPKYYNFRDKSKVTPEVMFKSISKFPKKFLVWQAMDQNGNVSEPFVKYGTLNAEEYRRECLQNILLPFLRKHHSLSDCVFWPDLATVHYARDVQNWMKANGITFVQKSENPPNCPQARPIEKFWALTKREYAKTTKVPKTIQEFKKIWTDISKRVAKTHAKSLMSGVRRRLRVIGDKGVLKDFMTKN